MELAAQRRTPVPFPPGDTNFSLRRTLRFSRDPLPILLDAYERHGPVFTLRILHANLVFMLGPAANHYITVSHAHNFIWRESHFAYLIALLGDGLLTTDGEYHRRTRLAMLPAFHRERIAASIDIMVAETLRALEPLRPGEHLDLYHWTRRLAMRIAMRALFGLDPDGELVRRFDAATLFEDALHFYATDYPVRILRGPGTPRNRLEHAARELDRLIYSEIVRRRAAGEHGEDILSILLHAHDEDGNTLSDRQIRDQVMTLLFAGHDTTTSTITFMFYELARHPEIVSRLLAEQEEKLPDGARTGELDPAQLMGGDLPQLEMVLDETLRKYPAAWVGPRRSLEPFEFEGVPVPGDAHVSYCSWASHHLPDVFHEPERFLPERFAPEAKAALPKGAYIPFGGGSRTCIGMRFGQLEIRVIATLLLARLALDLPAGHKLKIRQMPTISPKDGLPMILRERARVPAAVA